jgi:hypothetical protein
MGYLFGQKRRKVSRLQRQAARCFLVTQEASSVELGTWCWPRVVLIEKRPLTECERSSMKRAARSVGACQSRQRPSAAFCRASSLGHRISGESQGQSDFARVYTTKPLVRAPSGYATATLAPSKGRLMRCTVDGLTPNRSAMNPYARPPRSRQSFTNSFLQRGGYRRPTKTLPHAPGPRKPGADAFLDHGALELGNHAHHLKHRLACRRRGVEPLLAQE